MRQFPERHWRRVTPTSSRAIAHMIPLNSPQRFPPNALWYMLLRTLLGVLLILLIAGLFHLGASAPNASCQGPLCGHLSGNRIGTLLFFYAAVLLSATVLRYRWSFFVLTDKSISIQRGAVFRNSTTVRFDRIQDVATRRDPLHLMLGLSALSLWTASLDQRAGRTNRPDGLLLLNSEEAEWLKGYLSEPPGVAAGGGQAVSAAAPAAGARQPVGGTVFALALIAALLVGAVALWRTPSAPSVAAPLAATTQAAAPGVDGNLAGRRTHPHVVAVAHAAPAPTPSPSFGLSCAIRAASGAVPLCASLNEAARCQHETQFPSQPTAAPAELTLENHSNQDIRFYWLDRSGARALYAALPPGGHVTQPSHIGAHWLVSTGDDRCIAIFNAATTTIGLF
jgi:membrane protein YdbS with pleckstrin-like domain